METSGVAGVHFPGYIGGFSGVCEVAGNYMAKPKLLVVKHLDGCLDREAVVLCSVGTGLG